MYAWMVALATAMVACAISVGAPADSFSDGVDAYNSGDVSRAITALKRAVNEDPASGAAYFYLGLSEQKIGQFPQAAQHLSKAAELDPELPGLLTNLGIVHYQNGALTRAVQALQAAVASDPDDGAAFLFLGLARQGQGQYTDSVRSFHAAARADPDFRQLAAFNRGVSHAQAGESAAAEAALNEAIAFADDPETTASARALLEQLNSGPAARKPWSVTAAFGLQYDDNVSTDEIDNSSGLEDFAMLLEAGASYEFKPTPSTELEVGYDFSQSLYFDLTEFNLQSHAVSLYGATEALGADLSLAYSYIRSFLGGDDFLGMHYVAPTIGYSLTSTIYASVTYSYQGKNFVSDSARDADRHGLGATGYWFFMDGRGFVHAGVRYDDEHTKGREFEYDALNYALGVKLPLPAIWHGPTLRLDYTYYDRDYANLTPSLGVERADQRHAIKARIDVPVSRYLTAEFAYEYIDSDSNLPSSEFQENVVTVLIKAKI